MIRDTLPRMAIALLCVLAGLPACATEQLSLQQAVGLGLSNNPTIAAGKLSATAANQAAKGAKALVNPEISIAPSIIGTDGADSAILFVQPLEINGSRKVRGQIAASEASASCFEAMATQRDVILEVKQTYWDVAQAQKVVELNQENIGYLKTLNQAAQKQFDAGAIPGTQVIKTRVELATAKQELDQALLSLAQAKAALNALLDRPKDVDFVACDSLAFSDVVINMNNLQSFASCQRPEVAAAESLLAASKAQIKAARLLTVPDVAVEARRGTLTSESEGGVALSFNLPFLDWGSAKGERRRAECTAQSQVKQLEAVKNQVSLEVEQAVQHVLTSARIAQEYQGGILAESEQLAAKAQEGYARGATGYLDVLEAQRTLRTVKTNYYSALSDYLKSQAQLEWATGGQQ